GSVCPLIAVVVGPANKCAAIVLKSDATASLGELANRKSASGKLPAGPLIAVPSCGAFTDTVSLARQISTSETKMVLFWDESPYEKVLRTKDLGKRCR